MATDANDVIKLLKAANAEPIGFAFGIAPSGNALIADKSKNGEQMLAIAKKLPGVKQSCSGLARYSGTTLTLICDRPVPGLAKLAETWGKANKFSVKMTVVSSKEFEAEEKDTDEEEDEDDGDPLFSFEQIKRRLVQAKTKPMFFAFGLASGKGNDLLAIHPIKTGEKLLRSIRAENGAIKRASGTLTLEGSMVTFTCEDDPFASMKRSLRRLFKEWKLPLRVTIIGPSGEFDEPDEETEGEAEGGGADAAQDDGLAAQKRLNDALAALLPGLKQLFVSAPTLADAIRRDYAACQAAIKTGDLDTAQRLLDGLAGMESGEAAAPDDGAALRRLREELDGLLPALKAAARHPDRVDTIRAQWQAAEVALKSADLATAEAAIGTLRGLAEGGGDAAEVDLSFQARWAALADRIRETAAEIDGQLTALQRALQQYGDGDLTEIAKTGIPPIAEKIARYLADLATDMTIPADAPEATFRKAAGPVLKIAVDTRSYIESEDKVMACDRNPVNVKVTVRESLGDTLGALQDLLQAA